MKENEVINLAVEAGAELDEGFLYIHTRVCSGFIERFAKLVEQATLERAAKEFEQDECDNWRSDVYAGHAVSRIIRALKDSHE